MRRLSAEQASALIADYEAGASVLAVARKYRVAPETATRRIRLAGVPIRSIKPGLTPDQVVRARELHASGWSYVRIGAALGFSHTAVRRALLGWLG